MPIEIKQGMTITAPFLPEPAIIIQFQEVGDSIKLIARGENTGEFFD